MLARLHPGSAFWEPSLQYPGASDPLPEPQGEACGAQPPPDTSRAAPGKKLGVGVTELGVFVMQYHCSNS